MNGMKNRIDARLNHGGGQKVTGLPSAAIPDNGRVKPNPEHKLGAKFRQFMQQIQYEQFAKNQRAGS